MPGPPPKDPSTRARRNRAAGAGNLAATPPRVRRRPLPPHRNAETGGNWHAMTLAWWKDVWRSPMAAKFLSADVHGLYMLADLVDRFWCGAAEVAAEIRLQSQRFGLSPIDRWRLQWELKDPERGRAAAAPPAETPAPAEDPRNILKAVK